MPFGAEVLENGEIRFALWAPAAETVDLVLEDGGRPMHREDGSELPAWSVAWYLQEAC